MGRDHGGSKPWTEESRGRSYKAAVVELKPAWHCRFCIGSRGPWRNNGTLKQCSSCRVAKGSCYLQPADSGGSGGAVGNGGSSPKRPGCPSKSMLEGRDELARKLAKAEAELESLRKKKSGGGQSAGRGKSPSCAMDGGVVAEGEGDTEMEEQVLVYEYTVDQLVDQRRLLKAQGKDDAYPDVARLTRAIKEQQQARLADKPGHVRVARADRQVKQRSDAVAACEAKAAKLQDELASVQLQIATNAEQVAKAKAALADAECQRDELYKSLQAAGSNVAPVSPSVEGALAASALLPDEAFVALGCTKPQVNELLQKMQAAMETWQRHQRSQRGDEEAAFSDQDMGELERQSLAAKRVSEAAAARLDQAKKARSSPGAPGAQPASSSPPGGACG